jgi:hypothetical protein
MASDLPRAVKTRGDRCLSGKPTMRSGQPFRSAAISSMTAVLCSMTVARSTGWPFDTVSASAIQRSYSAPASRSAAFAAR